MGLLSRSKPSKDNESLLQEIEELKNEIDQLKSKENNIDNYEARLTESRNRSISLLNSSHTWDR